MRGAPCSTSMRQRCVRGNQIGRRIDSIKHTHITLHYYRTGGRGSCQPTVAGGATTRMHASSMGWLATHQADCGPHIRPDNTVSTSAHVIALHAALTLGPLCETLLVCSCGDATCSTSLPCKRVLSDVSISCDTWTVATFLTAGVQRSGARSAFKIKTCRFPTVFTHGRCETLRQPTRGTSARPQLCR